MTTNVFDQASRMMATDSRWSMTFGSHRLVYVDDVRFDKIERYKEYAFMFAGNGMVIQRWKDWIRGTPVLQTMPTPDGIAVCVVHTPDARVMSAENQQIIRDGGWFAGSGSRYAYVCWAKNKDPHRCIESAKQVDPCTGGEVKYLDMAAGGHNLCPPVKELTINDVLQAIERRGMIMDISSEKGNAPPHKLSDIAANDADLQDLSARIAAGEGPEAPCDGMYNKWTDDQKSKLQGVLAEVFGWK